MENLPERLEQIRFGFFLCIHARNFLNPPNPPIPVILDDGCVCRIHDFNLQSLTDLSSELSHHTKTPSLRRTTANAKNRRRLRRRWPLGNHLGMSIPFSPVGAADRTYPCLFDRFAQLFELSVCLGAIFGFAFGSLRSAVANAFPFFAEASLFNCFLLRGRIASAGVTQRGALLPSPDGAAERTYPAFYLTASLNSSSCLSPCGRLR
jgi:hypothetical protein